MLTLWSNGLLTAVLAVCVFSDIKNRKIYNAVIAPGLSAAFLLHAWLGGWSGLASSLEGFGLGLAILLIPYLTGGMGAGDVKLLALVGAFEGAAFVFAAAIYMALAGGILALIFLLFGHGGRTKAKAVTFLLYSLRYGIKFPLSREVFSGAFPYGVAIALGAGTELLFKGLLV